MTDDCYEKGKELTPEGLYQLATDEAMRDGVVNEAEENLLRIMAEFLRIEKGRALQIRERSAALYRQGLLGEERLFVPKEFYKRVLRYVLLGRRVSKNEQLMIGALRRLFKMTDEAHDLLFEQAQKELHVTQNFPVRRSNPAER